MKAMITHKDHFERISFSDGKTRTRGARVVRLDLPDRVTCAGAFTFQIYLN